MLAPFTRTRKNGLHLQTALSESFTTYACISRIESGERYPTVDVLNELVRILDTSFEYLVNGNGCKHTLDVGDLSAEDLVTLNAILSLMRKKK